MEHWLRSLRVDRPDWDGIGERDISRRKEKVS